MWNYHLTAIIILRLVTINFDWFMRNSRILELLLLLQKIKTFEKKYFFKVKELKFLKIKIRLGLA